MGTYSLKRLLSLIPVCLGVLTLVGVFIHFIPGDPVDVLAGDFATETEKLALREQLGLNKPIYTQIGNYIMSVFKGDLGNSLIFHRPVLNLIGERVLPTIELALLSLLLALVLSLPLGIFSAYKAGKWQDLLSSVVSLLGVSMPNFWLGPLLIMCFSLKLDLLPVSERGDWTSYILPALTLGTSLAAILTRMTRTSFLENSFEDYVRTAKAKGCSTQRLWLVHIFKNALLPIITILGLQFGVLLTGAVITEKIFDWPGLGTLLLEGIGNRDYPLVQGCVLCFSMVYVLVNLFTDLAYTWADPRIQLNKKG